MQIKDRIWLNKKPTTLTIWLLAIALFILNFSIKIWNISAVNISIDEPFSIYYAQHTISDLLNRLTDSNNAPLFELLLHFWIKLFGIEPFSVRFMSVVFASITAIVLFFIGKNFFSFKTGLITSLLYTFSNYHIFYAREARAYPLFILLTCLCLFYFLSLYKNPKSRKYLILLTLSQTLIIYTHFFGFFILFIELITVLLFRKTRLALLKKVLISFGLTLLLYSPLINVFIRRLNHSVTNGTWVPPINDYNKLFDILYILSNKVSYVFLCVFLVIWFSYYLFIKKTRLNKYIKYILLLALLSLIIKVLSNYFSQVPKILKFNSFESGLIVIITLCVILIASVIRSPRVKLATKITILWFSLPLVIMFISSVWVPMFTERYIIYFTPLFYPLIANGLDKIEIRKNYGLSILVIFLFISSFRIENNNGEYSKEVVKFTKAEKTDSTYVFICTVDYALNFSYYYNKQYFTDIDRSNINGKVIENLKKDNIYSINKVESIDANTFINAQRVIYIGNNSTWLNTEKEIKNYFEKYFNNVEEQSIESVQLFLFSEKK